MHFCRQNEPFCELLKEDLKWDFVSTFSRGSIMKPNFPKKQKSHPQKWKAFHWSNY